MVGAECAVPLDDLNVRIDGQVPENLRSSRDGPAYSHLFDGRSRADADVLTQWVGTKAATGVYLPENSALPAIFSECHFYFGPDGGFV